MDEHAQDRCVSRKKRGRISFSVVRKRDASPFFPVMALVFATVGGCASDMGEGCRNVILPEARKIDYHDPAQFPPARIPDNVPPRTVADPRPETTDWNLSLDEAIRISLQN